MNTTAQEAAWEDMASRHDDHAERYGRSGGMITMEESLRRSTAAPHPAPEPYTDEEMAEMERKGELPF